MKIKEILRSSKKKEISQIHCKIQQSVSLLFLSIYYFVDNLLIILNLDETREFYTPEIKRNIIDNMID